MVEHLVLIAIQRKNGSVEVFDTDETPAAYIFSVKERKLVADQFAEAQKNGSNKLVNVSMNTVTRPDLAGIATDIAMRTLFDHLSQHRKFAAIALQQFSLELASAETKAVDADDVKDATAPAVLTTQ